VWKTLRYILVDFAIVLYTFILGSLVIFLSWIPRLPGHIAKLWAWLILRTAGVKIEVTGLDNRKPHTPYVFMSNHMSHFDVLSLLSILPPEVRFLAKKELVRIPVFGWALYAMGHIIVDRGNQPEAFRSIDEGAKRVREGVPVLVFAEGTRSPNGTLQAFKKGGFVLAIKAGVDILPISISGSREVLPKGSLRVNPGKIRVVLSKPIPSSEHTLEKKERLMERVRAAIEAGLHIPLQHQENPVSPK